MQPNMDFSLYLIIVKQTNNVKKITIKMTFYSTLEFKSYNI